MGRFLSKIFSDANEPKEKPLVVEIYDMTSNKIHFIETDQAKNAHTIIVRIKEGGKQNQKEELDQVSIRRENIKTQQEKETKRFARKFFIAVITVSILLEIFNYILLYLGIEPTLLLKMSTIFSKLWFWGGIMFNKMT
ncbi:MAG: hypothetical protein D6748_09245 [Calditrichaeota bacterium]|nr:MAG: hypothetical protein D6748_09245 [Calditrichota bacterium]